MSAKVDRIAPHVVDIAAHHRAVIEETRVRLTGREGQVAVQLFGPRNGNMGAVVVNLADLKEAIAELEKEDST